MPPHISSSRAFKSSATDALQFPPRIVDAYLSRADLRRLWAGTLDISYAPDFVYGISGDELRYIYDVGSRENLRRHDAPYMFPVTRQARPAAGRRTVGIESGSAPAAVTDCTARRHSVSAEAMRTIFLVLGVIILAAVRGFPAVVSLIVCVFVATVALATALLRWSEATGMHLISRSFAALASLLILHELSELTMLVVRVLNQK